MRDSVVLLLHVHSLISLIIVVIVVLTVGRQNRVFALAVIALTVMVPFVSTAVVVVLTWACGGSKGLIGGTGRSWLVHHHRR